MFLDLTLIGVYRFPSGPGSLLCVIFIFFCLSFSLSLYSIICFLLFHRHLRRFPTF